MDSIKVKFGQKVKDYPKGITLFEVSKESDEVENIVGASINNEIYSLDKVLNQDTNVEFINYNHLIGNKIYKSGLKFIFEIALIETFPSLEVTYEHSVPRGMLGMITGDKILTTEDISKIKSKMGEIITADERIEKLNVHPKEAIKYYKKTKEYEKADNIQNINDKMVTLYKLHNKLNYFYTLMPYTTGVINKFELVYLGNNKIVFLFPQVRSKGVVPEYVHYDKIIESFYKGKTWLNSLKIPYVTDLNKTVASGSIKDFIRYNELTFSLEIAQIVQKLKENKDIKFILIAGPSSSGKTTTNSRIASYLSTFGYDPIKISLDDYFLEKENTPKKEDGSYDFESINALDTKKFNEDILALLNHEKVSLPVYNFLTGKREQAKKEVYLKENSIFLIEGLHALNDDLMPEIEDRLKYKIYLSPFIPLNVDRHNYISTLDLRLIRRIVRDNRTRGYDVIKTIDIWQSVRDGEEKYIFPYIHQADVIINTAMAYEVGVLKTYVEPLLYSVGVDSSYYEEARRLIDFLKQFFAIPGEYVDEESILREFIGGKYND